MTWTQALLYLAAMLVTAIVASQIFGNLAALALLVGAILTILWFWNLLNEKSN